MMDFLTHFDGLTKKTPAFIFTTCGLYSANTLRIFRKYITTFHELINSELNAKIPRFKLYSILNYPNKWIGERFSPTIYGVSFVNVNPEYICVTNEDAKTNYENAWKENFANSTGKFRVKQE